MTGNDNKLGVLEYFTMFFIGVVCVAPNDRNGREWERVKDMNEDSCSVSLYRNVISSDKISPVTFRQYD